VPNYCELLRDARSESRSFVETGGLGGGGGAELTRRADLTRRAST
jgi:hypothetical protein